MSRPKRFLPSFVMAEIKSSRIDSSLTSSDLPFSILIKKFADKMLTDRVGIEDVAGLAVSTIRGLLDSLDIGATVSFKIGSIDGLLDSIDRGCEFVGAWLDGIVEGTPETKGCLNGA